MLLQRKFVVFFSTFFYFNSFSGLIITQIAIRSSQVLRLIKKTYIEPSQYKKHKLTAILQLRVSIFYSRVGSRKPLIYISLH